MFLFLNGVGCVGKSTIGQIIAQKLGVAFHSVDYHVELFYGKSIERVQQDCIGSAGYNYMYAEALRDLLKKLGNKHSVVELPPSGLTYISWRVVKTAKGVTVALQDTAENILKRITFYDIDTKPLDIQLTEKEKRLYLIDIRKDITYYKRGQDRADFKINIEGMTPDQAAEKVIAAVKAVFPVKTE